MDRSEVDETITVYYDSNNCSSSDNTVFITNRALDGGWGREVRFPSQSGNLVPDIIQESVTREDIIRHRNAE